MEHVSYILTYRQGRDPSRYRNLMTVLRWLAGYPAMPVLVVEQDEAPRLDGPLPHPGCTHVFAYNPGPFNKSWGFNVGFRLSRTPWLAFADADLIPGSALAEALSHCGSGRWQQIKPYRRLFDLDEQETQQVASGDYDLVPERAAAAPINRESLGEYTPYAGGLILLSRKGFMAVGGWDERFRGWGGEDDAMSYRLERARLPGIELDTRAALHLHHPRPPESTTGQPHYADNLGLLANYRELDDAELKRFSEVQLQLIGYREKYRPR